MYKDPAVPKAHAVLSVYAVLKAHKDPKVKQVPAVHEVHAVLSVYAVQPVLKVNKVRVEYGEDLQDSHLHMITLKMVV